MKANNQLLYYFFIWSTLTSYYQGEIVNILSTTEQVFLKNVNLKLNEK